MQVRLEPQGKQLTISGRKRVGDLVQSLGIITGTVMVIRGDEIIAVARAQQSMEALRSLHVPVTYREYEMGHEISAESLADLSQWLEDKVRSPIILL